MDDFLGRSRYMEHRYPGRESVEGGGIDRWYIGWDVIAAFMIAPMICSVSPFWARSANASAVMSKFWGLILINWTINASLNPAFAYCDHSPDS